MSPDELIPLAQHALWVLVLTLAPVVLPALVIGLVVGMVQAATSINEATLALVPKLIVTLLCLGLFGALMVRIMSDFFAEVFARIPDMAR